MQIGITMSGREDRIRDEAIGLWTATHQGPPPPLDGPALIEHILRDCGCADYERLHSRHLRPGAITEPR